MQHKQVGYIQKTDINDEQGSKGVLAFFTVKILHLVFGIMEILIYRKA